MLDWFFSPGVILFAYFSIKSFFYNRRLGITSTKWDTLISLLLTIFGLVFHQLLLVDYQSTQALAFIKGVTILPPFHLLLILADVISSVLLLILLRSYAHLRHYIAAELFRILSLSTVFFMLVMYFSSQYDYVGAMVDYTCLRYTLQYQLAEYYFKNHTLPTRLSQFTGYENNPVNGSRLIYDLRESSGLGPAVLITDEAGNTIFDSYKYHPWLSSLTWSPPSRLSLEKRGMEIFCRPIR